MCRWPRQCSLSRVRVPWDSWPYNYCLRSETFLFVASYDSQGQGGGIRTRLHTVHRLQSGWRSSYITSGRTQQKSPPPTIFFLLPSGRFRENALTEPLLRNWCLSAYCTATAVLVRFEASAQQRVYTPQYIPFLRIHSSVFYTSKMTLDSEKSGKSSAITLIVRWRWREHDIPDCTMSHLSHRRDNLDLVSAMTSLMTFWIFTLSCTHLELISCTWFTMYEIIVFGDKNA
jgi:hypothetical protein